MCQIPLDFKILPPKEQIQASIDVHRRHLADLTSYLWYLMPLAEQLGERVYDVAARSLQESGIEATAEQLKALADEMQTPAGQERYAENRRIHIGTNLTGYKGV
jgi:hypothetical protein